MTELLRLTFVVPTEASSLLGQPWVSVVPGAPVARLLLGEGLVMSHPPQHCQRWKLLALVLWMSNFPISPGDSQETACFFSQLPSLQSHSHLQPQKDSVRRGPGRLQAGVSSLWASREANAQGRDAQRGNGKELQMLSYSLAIWYWDLFSLPRILPGRRGQTPNWCCWVPFSSKVWPWKWTTWMSREPPKFSRCNLTHSCSYILKPGKL